ncbi:MULTISPECIES: hypothetical protein [unclassified Stenotrophomonas]|uniref:hypothetical protein n=1 Tax=unclassified Stenotrophomonas TaxID=196198 RepID=UPI00301319E3
MKSSWIGIGGVALTVATMVLTLVLWLVDRQSNEMRVEVVSKASLAPVVPEGVVSKVSILINGAEVKSPSYVVLDFSNTGTTPVLASSFERDVVLSAVGARIESVQILKTRPTSLDPQVSVQDGKVHVAPLLLNPSDSFRLGLLTAGHLPKLDVSGRVAGVADISVVDVATSAEPPRYFRRTIGFLLLGFYSISLIQSFTHGPPFLRLGIRRLLGEQRYIRPSIVATFGVVAYIGGFLLLTEKELMGWFSEHPVLSIVALFALILATFAACRVFVFEPVANTGSTSRPRIKRIDAAREKS